MATTLADIRARLMRYYKRRDVQPDEIDEWIKDSVRRIQTTLRTPMDEAVVEAVVPATFAGSLAVPGNLVNLISIQVDGIELQMRSITEVREAQKVSGTTRYYARQGHAYLFAPMPSEGSIVTINYRADFKDVALDTDNIVLFDIMPDLVVYGALIAGSVYALDGPQMVKFNSIYNSRFLELQDMADRDDLLNGSIGLAYDPNGRF